MKFVIAVVKNESCFSCDVKCIEIILPFKNSASIDNIVVKPTDKSSTVYVEKALHLLCIENTKQRMKC